MAPTPQARSNERIGIALITTAVLSALAAFVGSDLPFAWRNAFGMAIAMTGVLLLALRFIGRTPARQIPLGMLAGSLMFFALATTISFLRD